MSSPSNRKYVKYEFTSKQKIKINGLATKFEVDPERVISIMEDFLDRFADYDDLKFWDKILSFLNMKMLDYRTRKMADDIIETKKKLKVQKELLSEYEEDYLAIVQLGKALESLNKV